MHARTSGRENLPVLSAAWVEVAQGRDGPSCELDPTGLHPVPLSWVEVAQAAMAPAASWTRQDCILYRFHGLRSLRPRWPQLRAGPDRIASCTASRVGVFVWLKPPYPSSTHHLTLGNLIPLCPRDKEKSKFPS